MESFLLNEENQTTILAYGSTNISHPFNGGRLIDRSQI
jgi:hypothetical protein